MSGLLCVHPHPDDESIACGGVLARYADEGIATMVVTCTGGEEGENLAGIDLGDEEMTSVRKREMAAALDALGVARHEFLGFRDSGMAGTPANEHPDAFAAADTDEAAERLAGIIRRFHPAVVVCDDERGSYGHPDHVKAHIVTRRALEIAAATERDLDGTAPWTVAKWYVHALPKSRLLSFHRRMLDEGLTSPFGDEDVTDVADLDFGVPDEDVTTAVDVADWLPRKRAAMRAHASQIGEESFFLNIPDDVARDVFGTEYFSLQTSEFAPDGEMEDDLFAGLHEARGTDASE